ncbi:hypothetical protein [Mixta intestinalis]|uniref:Uncharacterized protein n=1 Tax=Mixta intestinalis TaxID=1615494 RepID=A0A6P1Q6J7_9GAMM|nr:hypothetical protein [Mixta intestinalis]QHM74051.1 hypothetical protein C7M51_04412 [Mixta intestinalis]
MTDMEANGNRFWTTNVIIFAVLQFIFYMTAFFILYKTSGNFPGIFWRVNLLIALAAAAYTSVVPVRVRKYSEKILNGKGINMGYCCVVLPVMYLLIKCLLFAYFKWELEVTNKLIGGFCRTYMLLAPFTGFFIIKYYKDLK